LIVPFSWFIVQALIGLSSILTVSVLTIPFSTFSGIINADSFGRTEICTKYKYNISSSVEKEKANTNANNTSSKIPNPIQCV
jgi:hypothetical protein